VPTRKQRRRQQKNRRHEWEYVYVDDEGQEVDMDPAELRAAKREKEAERPRAGAAARSTGARGRSGRQIEPPSWRRVFKRALIFAPIFVVVLLLLNRQGSIYARVGAAIPLIVVFVPFSYFTDRLAYRTYQKRLARARTTAAKPKPR
jgi:hypothetical protein